MLSLSELRRAAQVTSSSFKGARLERIVQPGVHELVLCFYGQDPVSRTGRKQHLLLCCDPELGRISEPARAPRAPQTPPAFVNFLRPRLVGARLTGVRVIGADRQLALEFEAEPRKLELLLALHGRRSNLYVVDADGALLRTLRPLAETRPELSLGEAWRAPSSKLPDEGKDRWAEISDPEVLTAIEAEYSSRSADRESQDLERRIGVALRKERKRARLRLEKLERELAEADQASELQRRGELLKGVLGDIRAGDTVVTATDYETGERVDIPLEATLSAKQNLEATFKRYHKLLRRLTKAGGQLDAASEREAELARLQEQVDALLEDADAAPEALAELARQPELTALLAKYAPAKRRRQPSPKRDDRLTIGRFSDVPRRLHPRRYRSLDGLEIWVGRDDDGNDFLTTRLANGNDLFFHLDGAPGSHVVLRTEGSKTPPQESLLDACELAVHFSKAHRASRADVHIAAIKFVRKPKGAKPGLVWVTAGRSLHLRREEPRLERLLASRFDG